MYRLRAKVEIAERPDLAVAAIFKDEGPAQVFGGNALLWWTMLN